MFQNPVSQQIPKLCVRDGQANMEVLGKRGWLLAVCWLSTELTMNGILVYISPLRCHHCFQFSERRCHLHSSVSYTAVSTLSNDE